MSYSLRVFEFSGACYSGFVVESREAKGFVRMVGFERRCFVLGGLPPTRYYILSGGIRGT
jgi:hypothetical protein